MTEIHIRLNDNETCEPVFCGKFSDGFMVKSNTTGTYTLLHLKINFTRLFSPA